MAIACNLAPNSRSLPVQPGARLILTSRPGIVVEDGSITLPTDSVAIVQTDATL